MQGLGELEAAVMTVLDNLHRERWVARERHGKAYDYVPAFSREEASTRALRDVLDSADDPHAVLMRFVASASDEETDLLRTALRKKRIHRR